jgi:hypothetical protein
MGKGMAAMAELKSRLEAAFADAQEASHVAFDARIKR